MKQQNELYNIFKQELINKNLVCFGIGSIFSKCLHNYDLGSISMLIDNNKVGEKVKIKGTEYTIQKVDEIKKFSPEQVVILITVKGDIQYEMKQQLHRMGYFNIFLLTDIVKFEQPYFDDLHKYLITYSAKQIQKGYKLKIAHISTSDAGNAGDIVLNYCVRSVINKIFGDSYFEIYSTRDKVTPEMIDIYNQFDLVLIGGGGLFLPDTNSNDISGWQWACSNELMDQIKKPLIAFAVGYNYFNGQQPSALFKKSLRHFAKKVSFFGIRNQRSVNIISDILHSDYSLGGGVFDGVDLTYQPCPTTFIEKYTCLPEKVKTNSVAFSLGMDRIKRRFDNSVEKVLSEIAKSIKEIYNRGYKIFIPMHCGVDYNFLEFLYEQHFYDFTIVDMVDMSPLDIIDFYRKMDLVVGSRGHASMIPFGVGAKIISIGGHPKLKAFLEDIDALDWFIDVDEVETISARLLNLFDKLIRDDDDVVKRIHENQNRLYQITADNIQGIKEKVHIK